LHQFILHFLVGAMPIITNLLAAGLVAWLGLVALLIAVRVSRGDIRVAGFLADTTGAEIRVAPERVVALVAFPLVLLMYATNALNAELTVVGGRPVMPDVPEYLLMLLIGGNGLYLTGKIARRK
jgi:ABC-type amino acid transport system permease subunit